MMRFVRAPQKFTGMLQAVEKIDIQVVRNNKKQNLFGYCPVFEKLEAGPIKMVLNRIDDILENNDLEDIALNDGVPNQVNPKAVPEKRKTLSIRRNTLPVDDKYHPANEDCGCCLY